MEAHLTDAQLTTLAEQTPDFSYAYLKELCLGSILKWVQGEQRDSLFATITSHRELLISQSPILRD